MDAGEVGVGQRGAAVEVGAAIVALRRDRRASEQVFVEASRAAASRGRRGSCGRSGLLGSSSSAMVAPECSRAGRGRHSRRGCVDRGSARRSALVDRAHARCSRSSVDVATAAGLAAGDRGRAIDAPDVPGRWRSVPNDVPGRRDEPIPSPRAGGRAVRGRGRRHPARRPADGSRGSRAAAGRPAWWNADRRDPGRWRPRPTGAARARGFALANGLSGDVGLRELLRTDPTLVTAIDVDPIPDVDTPADLERITEPCPGCGARYLPHLVDETHPYIGASSACWATFGEVLAREFGDPSFGQVHRQTVDVYAVQHPGADDRRQRQSVALHLIGLCHWLEHGLELERLNAITQRLAAADRDWPWLILRPGTR